MNKQYLTMLQIAALSVLLMPAQSQAAVTPIIAQPTPLKPVCLYEHINYEGGNICLSSSTANLSGPWNDFASSVKILPGYEVILNSDINFGGQVLSSKYDIPNLVSRNFNDLASSYRVHYPPAACTVCAAQADVLSAQITNTQGKAPVKGDTLRMNFSVRNNGKDGFVVLAPIVSSLRFTDFSSVPFGSVTVSMKAGETKNITVDAGPFIDDPNSGKTYATGRGNYRIEGVRLTNPTTNISSIDTNFGNRDFTVGPSNAVLTAVVYDADYFRKIGYTQSPETYATEVATRPSEVFSPNTTNSSVGSYQSFASGFDQMMGVQHKFRTIPGFTSFNQSQGQFCEQTTAYGGKALGLAGTWTTNGKVQTAVNNHGFDYLIGEVPASIGGVTCGWLGVQVSGIFDYDKSLNRSQIIVVHEDGHIFNSPHCDPLQGYVMCSGEKHPHYQQNGIFVWHKISRDVMKNPFD
jgi:hypothetical protein